MIREKALGSKHPDVAESLDNLAILYKAQDHYATVEPLNKRVLSIRKKALGPEHPLLPETPSLNNLYGYLSPQVGINRLIAET